jgi:hypothetical protein
MTPQEQQLLKGLADRINQTVLQDKDPEAEQFLMQSLSRNPDALYIMAQTILVQQFAVDNAKKQLDDLKQQLEEAKQQAAQPVKHTSFLGGLLGGDEPQRPAPPPPPPPQQQYSQPQYQPVQNYAPPPPQYGQPVYAQPVYTQPGFLPGGIGGSGFLGSALKTAGIVGAGALAFEGVEGLMHGFGEHAGYGGGGYGMGGMGGGPREEIINNLYDGDRPEHRGLSDDIEDRRDDGDNQRGFADTSSDDDNTDDSSNFDDSSSDDSSSFDDSGSDDNS